MNKTKEEMKETAINPKIAETNIIKEAAEIIYKTLNRGQEQNSTSIINAIEQRINDCFISLTDQIKSMENYISDVDGQVKELKRLRRVDEEQFEEYKMHTNDEIEKLEHINNSQAERIKMYIGLDVDVLQSQLTSSEARVEKLQNGITLGLKHLYKYEGFLIAHSKHELLDELELALTELKTLIN